MSEKNQSQNTENLGELLKIRREKLAALQEAGKNPFEITKYDVTHHSSDVKENFDELECKANRGKHRRTYDVQACHG